MQDDVSRWCRECQKCQQRKTPHQKDCSPLQQYLVSAPVEHIALDILGLLPETYDGNHYTHVVGDYFSKWTDAWAMPDTETPTIVNILVCHVFCQWELPLHIHSDSLSPSFFRFFALSLALTMHELWHITIKVMV